MRMTDVCLVDAENPRKPVKSGVLTEGPIQIFTENEVPVQLGNMGLDKAIEPDGLPIEAVKILANQDVRYAVKALSQTLQQRISEILRKSRTGLIYEGKGYILECDS